MDEQRKYPILFGIDKRQTHSTAFPPFYFLVVTIYNAGELAASQLKGHCRLYSPANDIKEGTTTIERDFLAIQHGLTCKNKAFSERRSTLA